jgi:hypothetical protein
LKLFRKTIAATITAIAVAGVTMASAPPASAGVIPEPEIRDSVGGWTTYGHLTNGDPFIGRSLDPEAVEYIERIRDVGESALGIVCNALWGDQSGDGEKCSEVVLAAIEREQPLYWGQRPIWMRVEFSQYGYVTYLLYPSGHMTWYSTQYSW